MDWLRRLFGMPKRPPPLTPDERAARVTEVVEFMRRHERSSLWLTATDESRQSWLGGAPAMAAGMEWPRSDNGYLGFIGQLDLEEVRAAGGPDWLPASGALAFFFDQESYDGYRCASKVVHFTSTAGVGWKPPSDAPEDWFRVVRVRYVSTPSYPLGERSFDLTRGFTEDEDAVIEAELGAVEQSPSHRIGGYPDAVQGDDMEEECHQAFINGWLPKKPSEKAAPPRADDWRLLLQVDSDDQLATNWVDSGTLYFWVLEQDARAADFSRVWVTMQYC